MIIKTRFGKDAEITEKNLIQIKDGLLGFESYQNFAVIPHGEDSPFILLQSIDEPQLAFITIDPRIFSPNYLPDISDNELSSIGLKLVTEAVLLTIVVIPENPQNMSANLQAPLLINPVLRIGRQMISRSIEHKVRHYILESDGGKPENK